MQKFSDYLEDYVKANDISISDLAKETGIDRTVIYRYVKGSRIPSGEDVVLKIADALQMSVKERNFLIEGYDKQIYGETLVNSYYYVRELLEDLRRKSEETDPSGRQWEIVRELDVQTPVVCLNSREDIAVCILDLFEMIARKPEMADKIQLLMQPTYTAIQYNLLNVFRETDVKLEQLVCMEQNISKGYENLKIFQQLLPLCVGLKNYDAYYYYEALSSHLNDMSYMPNLILAGEYVVRFDYDMSQGMLIHDPSYVKGSRLQYEKMLAMSDRLIDKGKSIQEFNEFNRQFMFREGGSFFRQPCMAACFDREILEAHIYPMPGKEEFICGLMEKYGGWQDDIHNAPVQNMKVVSYGLYQGLEDFAETGIIEEFPQEFYRPLDPQVRKKILERMIRLIEEGMMTYRFIREEPELSPAIQLYWDAKRKRLSVSQIHKDRILQMVVEEGSIYRTFQNYLEYLEKKGKISSAQESLEMIEELKERCF